MDQTSRRARWTLAQVLLVLSLILAANSAYVSAYGEPNLFYVLNDLLHPLLGILVAILFILFLRRHRDYFAAFAGKLSVMLLAISAAYGIFLIFVGMTRPHALTLYLHAGFAIAGLFFVLVRLRTLLDAGWKNPSLLSTVRGAPPRSPCLLALFSM
jgi:cytochrome bd-type quinol oxidase subunit 2